jgi:hypothetical protein
LEDTYNIKDMLFFPAIDACSSKGLHWLEIQYDNSRMGINKFKLDEVSARDILVDSRSRGMMFKSAQLVFKRFSLEEDKAKQRYKRYPLFDPAVMLTDSQDYDSAYKTTAPSQRRFATFYLINISFPHEDYTFFNPETRQIEEIDEARHDELLKDPILSQYVLEEEDDDRFYYALYEEGNGVFFLDYNVLGAWNLTPMQNLFSEDRLYPYGTVELNMALEDLLSLLVTAFFENVKRTNYPIVSVTSVEAWTQYRDDIERAVNFGGAAPGIGKVDFPQSVSQGLVFLINSVIGWLQDSAALHAASQGELPTKQIAKETVAFLAGKDDKSRGRLYAMIDICLTQFYKKLVKLITILDTDEDYIPIQDPKSKFGFIPINKILSKQKYVQMLFETAGVKFPQNPQEMQAQAQMAMNLQKAFEDANDIKIKQEKGYVDLQGNTFRDTEILARAQEEQQSDQIDPVKFHLQHPELSQQTIDVYYVNMISPNIDLNVRYGIESDMSNDPEYRANKAILLKNQGVYGRLDFAEALDVANAQEAIERADAENQAMQLAMTLRQNPELMQKIQQMLQAATGGGQ